MTKDKQYHFTDEEIREATKLRMEKFDKNFPAISRILERFSSKYPEFTKLAQMIKNEIIDSIRFENEGRTNPYGDYSNIDANEFSKKIELLTELLLIVKNNANNSGIFKSFQESIHTELDCDNNNSFYIYYDPMLKNGYCLYGLKTFKQGNKYIPYVEKVYATPKDGSGTTKYDKARGFDAIIEQISKQRLN